MVGENPAGAWREPVLTQSGRRENVIVAVQELEVVCVHNIRLSINEFRSGVCTKALFSSQKILQSFSDSPSHRIFRHMHEVLNIDKNKN